MIPTQRARRTSETNERDERARRTNGQDFTSFLAVAVPGSSLEFVLWPDPAAAGQPAGTESGTAPGVVFLESDDLRKDFTVLRDRGVTFEQPEPEDYAFGVRIE